MENNFLNDLQKWNDESQRNNEENNSKNKTKEKEFLTERLNVRLTKSELEMLKQKSTLTGESIAKLIRLGIKNIEVLRSFYQMQKRIKCSLSIEQIFQELRIILNLNYGINLNENFIKSF
ncbi:hypothetical protein OBK16_12745 [Empedobacter falsenii]